MRLRKKRKALTPAETVHILASKGCSQSEIAEAIGISVDTLQRDTELYAAWKRGHNRMSISIHRAQYRTGVEKGNVTMLIWLGKNYLSQTDKVSVETERPRIDIQARLAELNAELDRELRADAVH
jgi:transcriptional regulator with XRE-family HTH domain